jgi:hypothetical protein
MAPKPRLPAMPMLERLYYPFTVALAAFFAFGFLIFFIWAASLGEPEYYQYVYTGTSIRGIFYGLYGLGWFAAVPMATSNLVVAHDDRYGTKPFDLIILVLAVLHILACLNVVTSVLGLAFCVLVLQRYRQR